MLPQFTEQLVPLYPAAQVHVPLLHAPWPEQVGPPGQVTEQFAPEYPVWHVQVLPAHVPWPEQVGPPGQVADVVPPVPLDPDAPPDPPPVEPPEPPAPPVPLPEEGTVKFQALACEVSTVMLRSPVAVTSRCDSHGSGFATPVLLAQTPTVVPFRAMCTSLGLCPGCKREPSSLNVSSMGAAVVAAGALISICWVRKVKPGGGTRLIGPSVMDTSPAVGETTVVVTGSLGVGPVPGSVVTVPPAETVACLVWVRNWIEMPICLLSNAWVVKE